MWYLKHFKTQWGREYRALRVGCAWEPSPGNNSLGGSLKPFLIGQTDGDKASYSPSPCFHMLNSPPCSPGPRIRGEQKWGVLDRNLSQEFHEVLFVCLVLLLPLVDGKKRQTQTHGRASSDNLAVGCPSAPLGTPCSVVSPVRQEVCSAQLFSLQSLTSLHEIMGIVYVW